jgi:predicted aminopeptidase
MPGTPTSHSLERALLGLMVLLTATGCRIAYVSRAAWHQGELMAAREPIDEVLERGDLASGQAEKLAMVPRIKAFGEGLGLTPTKSYESISARWDRSITNLSACQPLSLEPISWWFPVVGRVPYLGFFRQQDLDRWERRLREQGYDVYVRDVAAYSTLGWFRDPVLPGMLEWEEYWLAEVVLHELTHATLWVPGSVSFNETFANIVGEEAATRWMIHRYGADSPEVQRMWERREDKMTWRALLQELYENLDVVYNSHDTSDKWKLERKEALFSALERQVLDAGFHHPEPFARSAREGPWNNARVAQYRTYNHDRAALERLLDAQDGDLMAFIRAVELATSKQDDPWEAVAAEAPEAPESSK